MLELEWDYLCVILYSQWFKNTKIFYQSLKHIQGANMPYTHLPLKADRLQNVDTALSLPHPNLFSATLKSIWSIVNTDLGKSITKFKPSNYSNLKS